MRLPRPPCPPSSPGRAARNVPEDEDLHADEAEETVHAEVLFDRDQLADIAPESFEADEEQNRSGSSKSFQDSPAKSSSKSLSLSEAAVGGESRRHSAPADRPL